MTIEDEVRAASEKFYAALNRMLNGDPGSLADIWSHGSNVTTMHPIGGREVGWEQVRNSWEQVAQLTSNGQVTLEGQLIQADGDMGYELGVERGEFSLAGQQIAVGARVTNVYRREDGYWKIVHHHTDTSSEMVDVLSRIKK